MTRPALVLLALVAGCGPLRPALTPALVSVPRLAPDLVPDSAASTAVVTASAPGRGVSGRVLDRDMGVTIGGVQLEVTDADGTVLPVETDLDGRFYAAQASGVAAVSSRGVCYAPLDARPAVDAGRSAALVVLLATVPC